ncbi:MAG: iron ABC transporter, partial [Pseudomonadota bacterium]
WLILDEPVANLDIAHQLKIMELARSYALDGGGVMAVMHDLNLTGLFADRVIVLSQARILAVGAPAEVFTDEILSQAYGCTVRVNTVPKNEVPFILPQAAAAELS